MVWVLGGNAFLLMRAMRQGGFSEVIVELSCCAMITSPTEDLAPVRSPPPLISGVSN